MAFRTLIALALAVLAVACGGRDESRCATPRAATPLDRATTGTINGTVTYQGTPPAMKTLALTSDCAAQHAGAVRSDDALVRDGRVENVFVWLKEGLGDRVFAVPDAPVTIDQTG